MRKFKHKVKGEFTTELIGCNKVEGIVWGHWKIPMWVLENGNDWEELKVEPLFISYDGEPIFEGDVVWVPKKHKHSYLGIYRICVGSILNERGVKYFAEKENADKFIKEHRKTYTLNEVLSAVNYWSLCTIDKEDVIKYFSKL